MDTSCAHACSRVLGGCSISGYLISGYYVSGHYVLGDLISGYFVLGYYNSSYYVSGYHILGCYISGFEGTPGLNARRQAMPRFRARAHSRTPWARATGGASEGRAADAHGCAVLKKRGALGPRPLSIHPGPAASPGSRPRFGKSSRGLVALYGDRPAHPGPR